MNKDEKTIKVKDCNGNIISIDIDCSEDILREELIVISRCGNLKGAQKIIELGADVNAKNNEGETAIYTAINYGEDDIVKN